MITVQLETIPDDPDDPDELASLEGAFTTSLQASLPSGSKVVNLKIFASADSRIIGKNVGANISFDVVAEQEHNPNEEPTSVEAIAGGVTNSIAASVENGSIAESVSEI